MAFERTGTCNRCGQCCGADGSPNQANPWPVNWLESHEKWGFTNFDSVWPYTILFGLIPDPSTGEPIKSQEYGLTKVVGPGGDTYYYVWVDGRPLKDTSVVHDGSSSSLECPFLKPDPGDGSRPCGLAGTSRDDMFLQVCFPEGPLVFQTQAMVDQWQTDHPLCSHDWVEV